MPSPPGPPLQPARPHDSSPHSTYVVRVWLEPGRDAERGWRASVVDVRSRETHYFADPAALQRFFAAAANAPPEEETAP